jgi:hypothetical protein
VYFVLRGIYALKGRDGDREQREQREQREEREEREERDTCGQGDQGQGRGEKDSGDVTTGI